MPAAVLPWFAISPSTLCLQPLSSHNASNAVDLHRLAGRNYHCHCGQPLFFRNSKCLACGTPLGYDCERGVLLSLMPGPQPDTWQAWQDPPPPQPQPVQAPVPQQVQSQVQQQGQQPQGGLQAGGTAPPDNTPPPLLEQIPGQESAPPGMALPVIGDAQFLSGQSGAPVYKRCLNLSTPAACNWLIAVQDPHDMCRACRLNRTIPDLTDPALPDNGYLWGLVELAKRRLVSSLIVLGLPVASRVSEDPQRGLMFDFLRSPRNGPHVMTGHNTGLVTLNVDEADDAKRETARKAMREPYRTLLGHFRHEVGHYYWDRLVAGTPWMDGFRQLFGDESLDYRSSLQRNYSQGPPRDWPLHFVSAYASSHPWEDWAECWAHYLHLRDAIDTALSLGISVDRFELEFTPFTLDALYQPEHADAGQFLAFLNHWTRLTTLLNEMSRSMGQPDFYPFVLPRDVVAKLHFIHLVVTSGAWLQDPPLVPVHNQNQSQDPTRNQTQALPQIQPQTQASTQLQQENQL